MFAIPYFISWAIGYLLLRILLNNSRLPISFLYVLGLGLGLGISSSLTFFAFLLAGKFTPFLIISFNLACLLTLVVLAFRRKTEFFASSTTGEKNHLIYLIQWLLFIPLALLIAFIATKHPYGEWDAWGMWNLKTKFLILSEQPWEDVLANLHPYTHPDYPLLLPFMNIWIYSFGSQNLYPVPMITAILFTIAGGLLTFIGLEALNVKKRFSVPAALVLMASPYYIHTGTAQYADVLLAFYLLAALIFLLLTLRNGEPLLAFCCGLTLGLLSFIKNEGLVMALLLTGLTAVFSLFQDSIPKRCLKFIFIGILITGLATLIFKTALSPANKDILPNITSLGLFDSFDKKLALIGQKITKEIVHEKWCGFWLFIILMVLSRLKRFWEGHNKVISLFFLSYIAVIILIYVSSPMENLSWWLSSSLARLYFAFMPAILFFCFYVHFAGTKESSAVQKIQASRPAPLPAKVNRPQSALTRPVMPEKAENFLLDFSNFLPRERLKLFIVFVFLFIIFLNVFLLANELRRIKILKNEIARQNIGYQFAGLNEPLKGVESIGYFVGPNLKTEKQSKLFAHAQFMLAPILLDFNSLDHEYILFVCPREEIAWQVIKQIGAEPILRNKFGMVLAKRKR